MGVSRAVAKLVRQSLRVLLSFLIDIDISLDKEFFIFEALSVGAIVGVRNQNTQKLVRQSHQPEVVVRVVYFSVEPDGVVLLWSVPHPKAEHLLEWAFAKPGRFDFVIQDCNFTEH